MRVNVDQFIVLAHPRIVAPVPKRLSPPGYPHFDPPIEIAGGLRRGVLGRRVGTCRSAWWLLGQEVRTQSSNLVMYSSKVQQSPRPQPTATSLDRPTVPPQTTTVSAYIAQVSKMPHFFPMKSAAEVGTIKQMPMPPSTYGATGVAFGKWSSGRHLRAIVKRRINRAELNMSRNAPAICSAIKPHSIRKMTRYESSTPTTTLTYSDFDINQNPVGFIAVGCNHAQGGQ